MPCNASIATQSELLLVCFVEKCSLRTRPQTSDLGFFSLIRLVFSPEGRTFALELFRQILSCWSSCATFVLFVEWTTMLGSFSFLAIRKHVSMSQSTSAGSAAQPAPTKWHRGIPSSSVRQFRQVSGFQFGDSGMVLGPA